ncbi:hypothetical protein TrRE_jg3555 [Triparma retinervis]|uniref:Uncharacterized protein n=1 Tax=Triparma retinervis TaxID=2557542 RepID=A0A9W7FBJ8_9STRA|nr:hypothetical protein TrRE_jg3555 [Triparma retinervis]
MEGGEDVDDEEREEIFRSAEESSGSNASSWSYGVFRHDPDLAPSAGDSSYGFERGYVDVCREGEGGKSERVKILVKGSNRQINRDWVRVKVTETTDKDGTGEGRQERKKEAEEEEVFEGYFQLVDLDASIPKDIFYHPSTSMIARAAKKRLRDSGTPDARGDDALKKEGNLGKKLNKKAKLREESRRMNELQSSERRGLDGEGGTRHNYNFAQFHDFGNIVRMEYLGGGEIVVVEGTKREIRGRAKGYGMG